MTSAPVPPIGSAEYKADAHCHLARLRSSQPVHPVRFAEGINGWLVVGYETAREALVHPAVTMDPAPARAALEAAGITAHRHGREGLGGSMFTADGEEHSRLRRGVFRRFSAQDVALYAGRVQQIADELISGFSSDGRADLVGQYCRPLVDTVMGEILGIDRPSCADLRRLASEVLDNPSDQQRRALAEFNDLVESLIAAKRENPADDLICDLLACAQEGSGPLTAQDVLANVKLLAITGFETPANFIALAALALLRHPGQIPVLLNPDSADHALEELLRYDHPLDYSPLRFAVADLTLAGHRIPRGSAIALSFASAGRDISGLGPQADPDRLDLTRPQPRHLAFSYGPHYCPAAALARLEAKTGLTTLFSRLKNLTLEPPDVQISWREGGILRGPVAVPVSFPATGTTLSF